MLKEIEDAMNELVNLGGADENACSMAESAYIASAIEDAKAVIRAAVVNVVAS